MKDWRNLRVKDISFKTELNISLKKAHLKAQKLAKDFGF